MTRTDNRSLKFGIVTVVTDSSIPTVELAQWAEDRGFESLFMGEHSHIPTSRRTPYPSGAALPEYCLLTEHHPISLAKTVATLDTGVEFQ